MSNEELLARDMAGIVREYVATEIGKLRAEIVAVKAENAELRGQFQMLKELFVCGQKQMPDHLAFPGEANARARSYS
jgi:hypothetical protein